MMSAARSGAMDEGAFGLAQNCGTAPSLSFASLIRFRAPGEMRSYAAAGICGAVSFQHGSDETRSNQARTLA
jgi:hypothetical protein